MVQAIDLRYGNDSSDPGWQTRPRKYWPLQLVQTEHLVDKDIAGF